VREFASLVCPAVDELDPDPLRTLEAWYREAEAAGIAQPDAAALATATPDGRPSARMVLLRGLEAGRVTFFTNRSSRKGDELAASPRVALVLHWYALGRQVRIEGSVVELSREEVDAHWQTRPRGSRIAAWASDQSRPVGTREELEARWAEGDRRFPGDEVPLPDTWSGFRVDPEVVELWRHRENRLHDRIRYERDGDAWTATRLMP
jgi:pyridoxamine 5'-phosphate oxidase